MIAPKLRFRGFSDEWEVKNLGEVVDNVGGTALEEHASIAGTHKFISIGNYSTDGRYIDNNQRISLNKRTNTKLLNKNDLVMVLNDKTAAGDIIGASILINKDDAYIYNQRSERLIPKDIIAPQYLWQYLNNTTFRKKVFSISQGGTQIYVNFPSVKKLPVGLPIKPEQEKIAEFFGVLDDKISGLEKKKELLEKYKKGVMQKIFTQQIRFKGFSGKWEEKKLGELGIFKSGVGFSENQQGGKTGIPFYKVSDMNIRGNEKIMTFANNYVSEDRVKKNRYNIINNPSIIFAKVGAAIFLERKRRARKFLIDNNMMAFIPNSKVNYSFVSFIFSRERLSRLAQVGALPSYNGSDLAIIKVSIPSSIEEQEKIADFLTALGDKIDLTERELEQAKRFKKSLLQQMFV